MKYTKPLLQEVVSKSNSVADVLRFLGIKQAGGNFAHIKKRMKQLEIDTSHFLPYTSNLKSGQGKKTAAEVLILRECGLRQKSSILRRSLLESEVEYKCCKCGLGALWNNKPLVLEVDHINENWLDDRIENLQFLCPNCHSQK